MQNTDLPTLAIPRPFAPDTACEPKPADLAELLRDHFDFVWRSLRRLGLDEGHADDAAQEVFLVVSRKQHLIEAGRERSFLFGTAMRVASDFRKRVARRREVQAEPSIETVDPTPSPETLIEQHQARAVLDELLDELPSEVRTIFILFELEGMEMQEIAELLTLHPGTVASRLRRSRAIFNAAVKRKQARLSRGRGER
jgi:RNA polymerase sigma-70 factor (ECF subfamily)